MARRRRRFSGVANRPERHGGQLVSHMRRWKTFGVQVRVTRASWDNARAASFYEATACPKGRSHGPGLAPKRCGYGSGKTLTGAVKKSLNDLSKRLK